MGSSPCETLERAALRCPGGLQYPQVLLWLPRGWRMLGTLDATMVDCG